MGFLLSVLCSGRPIELNKPLVGLLLSVICGGCPIELDKPHILALAVETGFLLFKEQDP
jgi:hypothetical protein